MGTEGENFVCIEEIGDEFSYLLNSPDGFIYSEGVNRCEGLEAQLTSISSVEEYNLILDFSFQNGIDEGFINPNGGGDEIRTWIGLTLSSSAGIIGFEDGTDSSFFENFQQFPWNVANEAPEFFDDNEIHGAVFQVNKANTDNNNLFDVDFLNVTYGIICRRPSISCGIIEVESEGEEEEEEGLISFEIYVGGMAAAGIVLFVSIILLIKVEKKKKKKHYNSTYKSNFELSLFDRE